MDDYTAPADGDVDSLYGQLERCMTAVLDELAPIKGWTKRRGKRDSR